MQPLHRVTRGYLLFQPRSSGRYKPGLPEPALKQVTDSDRLQTSLSDPISLSHVRICMDMLGRSVWTAETGSVLWCFVDFLWAAISPWHFGWARPLWATYWSPGQVGTARAGTLSPVQLIVLECGWLKCIWRINWGCVEEYDAYVAHKHRMIEIVHFKPLVHTFQSSSFRPSLCPALLPQQPCRWFAWCVLYHVALTLARLGFSAWTNPRRVLADRGQKRTEQNERHPFPWLNKTNDTTWSKQVFSG